MTEVSLTTFILTKQKRNWLVSPRNIFKPTDKVPKTPVEEIRMQIAERDCLGAKLQI